LLSSGEIQRFGKEKEENKYINEQLAKKRNKVPFRRYNVEYNKMAQIRNQDKKKSFNKK
jgi:hypothetical protein